jgi:hypothetical protein
MNKKQKIQAIKDLLEGKPPPPLDGVVIEQRDGRYRVMRLGREFILSAEEFARLRGNQKLVFLPEKDPITEKSTLP